MAIVQMFLLSRFLSFPRAFKVIVPSEPASRLGLSRESVASSWHWFRAGERIKGPSSWVGNWQAGREGQVVGGLPSGLT